MLLFHHHLLYFSYSFYRSLRNIDLHILIDVCCIVYCVLYCVVVLTFFMFAVEADEVCMQDVRSSVTEMIATWMDVNSDLKNDKELRVGIEDMLVHLRKHVDRIVPPNATDPSEMVLPSTTIKNRDQNMPPLKDVRVTTIAQYMYVRHG
eukprot:GILJ01007306.1.p1 GENE.GILJ01007306.1~~GILJ01007306.1.p1  ORF type:complete len:149 (+),score=14.12 GILJ01007306.1:400-846(+)